MKKIIKAWAIPEYEGILPGLFETYEEAVKMHNDYDEPIAQVEIRFLPKAPNSTRKGKMA